MKTRHFRLTLVEVEILSENSAAHERWEFSDGGAHGVHKEYREYRIVVLAKVLGRGVLQGVWNKEKNAGGHPNTEPDG